MLSRHRRATNDEEISPGVDDGLGEPRRILRRQGPGHRHSGGPNLGHPGGDELGLDRLGVDLLHAAGGGDVVTQPGQLLEVRRGILVTGPQSLEVEHTEATQAPELDGRRRAHHRVHWRGHDREVEGESVDAPLQVHHLGAAGAPGRDESDVIQAVRPGGTLAASDVVHNSFPAGFSGPPVSGRSSWGPRPSSECRADETPADQPR